MVLRLFRNFSEPTFTNGDFHLQSRRSESPRPLSAGGSKLPMGGFSFLVLFSFVITFLVWCIGMYVAVAGRFPPFAI